MSLTRRFSNYTKADTWYPSWGGDRNTYSPKIDGTIGKDMEFVWAFKGEKSKRGYAKIIGGNDPMFLK